jgi:hypothetical protein
MHYTSLSQTESHNRIAPEAGAFLGFLNQRQFQVVRIRFHLAGGDLFIAGAGITKFATSQTPVGSGTHGRTKDPASHGPEGVQIAHPSHWIESGARFIVGETSEASFGVVIFAENSCGRIARKIARKPRQ